MIKYGEVRDLQSGASAEDSDPEQVLDFVCGACHGGSLSGGAKLFNGPVTPSVISWCARFPIL